MSASPQRPARTPSEPESSRARGVDDFARSVHASYLSRWMRHDPAALEAAAQEEAQIRAAERKRRKRTSAA